MSATPYSTFADPQQIIAELQRQLGECRAERDEALAQQTATAEVLQIINSSPRDLAPVFDAILEKALCLCEAAHGHIWRIDGQHAHAVALRGDARFIEAMRQDGPAELVSKRPLGRIARGEHVVHLPDATREEVYRTNPAFRKFIDASEIRTGLMVALRKDEALLGAIVVHRKEVLPFTDKQIALLQNFAAQAVIAMENARLLTETHEALEQQTATAEVLQVINSSPGDLEPVFQAIVEKAHTLCSAVCGSLQLWDGEKFRGIAMRGFSEAMAEGLRQGYIPGPNHPCRRLLEGERVAHCADLAQIDDPVTRAGGVALDGVGTILFVALRKDDGLLGQIVAARREVRPFTESEIALVENFAAQAVIAMENARLLTETREALEQQTATAEVLQVINSSPGDLKPVFDVMLEKAMGLCEAAFGMLQRFDGERFEVTALRSLPPAYAEFLLNDPPHSGPGTAPARILAGEQIVHIHDLKAEGAYANGDPRRRALVDLGGARTSMAAALRKEGMLLGTFTVYREEVRPFTEKQIGLLQNFAAQAVIAMENARLLAETREALEQQTATAEVLGVINSSPGDLAPVFDAILEKALNLSGAAHGALTTYDGEQFRAVASHNIPEPFGNLMRQPFRPPAGGAHGRLLQGERLIHIVDVAASEPINPMQRAAIDAGVRTLLMVPLRKEYAAAAVFHP
jgi:GAF domain-containing protein